MKRVLLLALLAGCSEPRPDPGQLALGEKLYAQHCASCHGAKLEGQPYLDPATGLPGALRSATCGTRAASAWSSPST